MMNEKGDIKKKSLVSAIRKAGYEIGKSYYEGSPAKFRV